MHKETLMMVAMPGSWVVGMSWFIIIIIIIIKSVRMTHGMFTSLAALFYVIFHRGVGVCVCLYCVKIQNFCS